MNLEIKIRMTVVSGKILDIFIKDMIKRLFVLMEDFYQLRECTPYMHCGMVCLFMHFLD